jgi:predicted ATP-grasp superfamily ATP-dependent carboligase
VTPAPRALVTDGEHRAVLAACRGLHRAGYAVTVSSAKRVAMAAWSRATERRITLPDARTSPELFVEALAGSVASRSWDVLVPGTEASLLPVSAARDELEPHVAVGLPPHPIVLRSLDKHVLQLAATEVGLAPPTSIACKDRSEAVAAATEIGFPLVVKPARSFQAVSDAPDAALEQRGPVLVEKEGDLDAALRSVRAPMTVQRFVQDPRIVSCAGVRLPEGVAGFTVARYVRTWSPGVGSAAFARTSEPPEGLRSRIEELLARIGWEGIFELELFDEGDGRFEAIDLNPRPFGWLSLAIGAGANLPAIWCDHVLGRSTAPAADAAPGYGYRWEEGELKYVVRHVRQLDKRAFAPLRPQRKVIHACFELRDPAPFLAQSLGLAGSLFGRKD